MPVDSLVMITTLFVNSKYIHFFCIYEHVTHLNKLSALKSIDRSAQTEMPAGSPVPSIERATAPCSSTSHGAHLPGGHSSRFKHTPLPQPHFKTKHVQCCHPSEVLRRAPGTFWNETRSVGYRTLESWYPVCDLGGSKRSSWMSSFGPAYSSLNE